MLSATHRLITLLALATLGCGAQPEVRYSSDVRPILDARCVDCHQRGGEAHLAPAEIPKRVRERELSHGSCLRLPAGTR